MPPASQRVFRIERTLNANNAGNGTDRLLDDVRHRELMRELASIKALLKSAGDPEEKDEATEIQKNLNEMSHELLQDLAETKKLQFELKEVHAAIERTKREILSLHNQAADGKDISRVSDELDAIVQGTETATDNILEAAEEIDQNASVLVAALKDEGQHNAASDIQDNVVKIFEACNFQDLTGQRISKVVSAFRYVDDRITKMLDIWGGIESFNSIELDERSDLREDSDLLNGPALDQDVDVASQDDIDALFD